MANSYTRFMLAHINHFWHDKHALQFRRGSRSEAIRIMDSFHCSAVSLYSLTANAFQLFSSVRWKRNKTGLLSRKHHGELADALLSSGTQRRISVHFAWQKRFICVEWATLAPGQQHSDKRIFQINSGMCTENTNSLINFSLVFCICFPFDSFVLSIFIRCLNKELIKW